MFHKTVDILLTPTQQVSVSATCYPHHWGMHWRENGARKPFHVLDTTLMIGPWSFNILIWPIGRLSWALRWIPATRRRRGYCIGW